MHIPLSFCVFALVVSVSFAPADDVTIAGFNIQNMGTTKLDKEHIVQAIIHMIKGFDVTVIYEVQAPKNIVKEKLIAELNKVSGRNFQYVQSGKTGGREYYGIVYDPTKVTKPEVSLFQTSDRYGSIDEKYFPLRLPLIASMTSIRSAVSFTIVGMHSHLETGEMSVADAKAYKAITSFNGFKQAKEKGKAKKGFVQYQKAELDLASLAQIYKIDLGQTGNVLIMGDLNADCGYLRPKSYNSIFGGKYNTYMIDIFDASVFSQLVTGLRSQTKNAEKMYTNVAGDYSVRSKKDGKGTPCAYDNMFLAGPIRQVQDGATVHRFQDEININTVDWDDKELATQKNGGTNKYKQATSVNWKGFHDKDAMKKAIFFSAISDHYPVSVTLRLSEVDGASAGGLRVVPQSESGDTMSDDSGESTYESPESDGYELYVSGEDSDYVPDADSDAMDVDESFGDQEWTPGGGDLMDVESD